MTVDITFEVLYDCGCKEICRSSVNVPKDLASAPRTEENDRALIDYINSEYCTERLHCSKRHRYGAGSFLRITEIL